MNSYLLLSIDLLYQISHSIKATYLVLMRTQAPYEYTGLELFKIIIDALGEKNLAHDYSEKDFDETLTMIQKLGHISEDEKLLVKYSKIKQNKKNNHIGWQTKTK